MAVTSVLHPKPRCRIVPHSPPPFPPLSSSASSPPAFPSGSSSSSPHHSGSPKPEDLTFAMAGDRTLLLLPAAFMFLLAGSVASASASFISVDVFESHGSAGRSLLQATQSCPINFEFLNYTILTSQCKGPQYAASLCCAAFKEFACPYAEQINDLSNDCSSTMFSYINLYGKYPPGLFANECKEGKNGLQCDSPDTASDSTSIRISKSLFSVMVAISGLVIAFLLH